MEVCLVVAVADNGVIGRDGRLPWHMPSDLKQFRTTTMGRPVLMGRRTFDSIGKPLPGRDNIVVSRNFPQPPPGVHVAPSVEQGLDLAADLAKARGVGEVMVIGGAQIYDAIMPVATRIYLTRIHATPAGDTTFDEPDPAKWRQVRSQPLDRGPGDEYAATLVVFERIGP